MFAVPGWSVSAAVLVPETSRPKSEQQNGKISREQGDRPGAKRKRRDAPRSKGEDLESLWQQRFSEKENSPGDETKGVTRKKKHQASDEAKDDQVKISSTPEATRRQVKQSTTQDNDIRTSSRINKSDKITKSKRPRHDGKQNQSPAQGIVTTTNRPSQTSIPPAPLKDVKLTPLQTKMRDKLISARFRHLNQTLYTTSSKEAMQLFTDNPDMFVDYHAGFSQQVKDSWPQNPVDEYIRLIKTRGDISPDSSVNPQKQPPLPRRKTGSCTIADLGCGDAPLARGCQSQIRALQLKFHSYDLHAPNSHVTKADISNLPLRDGEADIAIFCLSLMGTNWLGFVEEAWRILRGDGKGEVWVAEVKSRFGRNTTSTKGRVVDHSVGKNRKTPAASKPNRRNDKHDEGVPDDELFAENDPSGGAGKDETDISAFVQVFSRRGFMLRENSVDKSNKMFVTMVFTKSGVPTAGKHKGMKWNGKEYQKINTSTNGRRGEDEDEVSPQEEAKVLKPCVYKSR